MCFFVVMYVSSNVWSSGFLTFLQVFVVSWSVSCDMESDKASFFWIGDGFAKFYIHRFFHSETLVIF